jgi:hypothetical protein
VESFGLQLYTNGLKFMKYGLESYTTVCQHVPTFGLNLKISDFRRVCNFVCLYMKIVIKVKVNLSLCLIKHYTMKTCGESGDMAPPFLILSLDEGEW